LTELNVLLLLLVLLSLLL